MNEHDRGLHILHLLEGIGIAAVSGIALEAIPREKNPLQGADTTTWLYRNLGPHNLKLALLATFTALLVYGVYLVVRNARLLWRGP